MERPSGYQRFTAPAAHFADLSVWHEVQAFGVPIAIDFKTMPHEYSSLLFEGVKKHIASMYENRGDEPVAFGTNIGIGAQLSGAQDLYNMHKAPRV